MEDYWSDAETDGTTQRFSPDRAESLNLAVLFSVAEALDADAESLPPLRDVVDPDALDALVVSPADVAVTFRYAGCLVRVRPAEAILVSPLENGD
jgi:hypothetical protein